MIYFQEELNYLKINKVSEMLNTNPQKLYELMKDLESYNVITFKKTPFGSKLIEENQINIIKEYKDIKEYITLPSEATSVIKNMNTIDLETQEDFSWAKNLNNVIWRRH